MTNNRNLYLNQNSFQDEVNTISCNLDLDQESFQAGKEKESQSLSVVRWIIHQASGLLGLATFNPI